MSPTLPAPAIGHVALRQVALRPRDSDGVGCALRQVFGRQPARAAELDLLLARLDQKD